jgi:hypothetical protein
MTNPPLPYWHIRNVSFDATSHPSRFERRVFDSMIVVDSNSLSCYKPHQSAGNSLPLMRIWHPEVHTLFGEHLHYYLLTLRPFNPEMFRKKMESFRKEQSIGGFSYYEVFGAFDIILRVWIPATQEEDKFVNDLRKYLPEIERAMPFRITEIQSYWCRDEDLCGYNANMLDRVTVNRVREIQNGHKSQDADDFKKGGLLAEVEQSKDTVKFFITLSNPQPIARDVEQRFQRELIRVVDSFREPANQLQRVSTYFGYGFAWVLIKAETLPQNYFLVGKLIDDLNEKLWGFVTTTYLATGLRHAESDDISNLSLSTASGYDLKIARLLPDFYDTQMGENLQRVIISWVREHDEIEGLKEDHRALVVRALSGVITGDEKAILAAFQDFFIDQERFLRKNWRRFVSAKVGDSKVKEVLRAAKIPEGERMLALGELCNIYAQAIRQSSNEPANGVLVTGWEAVANLRNVVAHGACNALDEWEEMLSTLIIAFSKLDHLEKAIQAAIGASPSSDSKSLATGSVN